jgi:hypothetical protein
MIIWLLLVQENMMSPRFRGLLGYYSSNGSTSEFVFYQIYIYISPFLAPLCAMTTGGRSAFLLFYVRLALGSFLVGERDGLMAMFYNIL